MKRWPSLSMKGLLPAAQRGAKALVDKKVLFCLYGGHLRVDHVHRIQEMGVLVQHHELTPGLPGDVEKSPHPLDVARAEVRHHQPAGVPDRAQRAEPHLLLAYGRALLGLVGETSAFAEQHSGLRRATSSMNRLVAAAALPRSRTSPVYTTQPAEVSTAKAELP